jgi:hypothetical protein
MALYDRYFELATEHRIDLHKFSVKFIDKRKPGQKTFDALTAAATPTQSFLGQWQGLRDGKSSPYGFRWSSTDLPIPDSEKDSPTEEFWKDLNASVLKHQLKQSFVYFVDEPTESDIPRIKKNLEKIRKWAPDLSFLGTLHYRESLDGLFTAWCPNVYEWDRPGRPTPEFYQKRRKEKAEQLWLYPSCNSHGCSGASDLHLPDLVTDRPSAFQRVLPWVALRYQADGILYYNTVEAYGKTPDSPWKDLFLFTGYGEGNLFYPCRPDICGVPEPLVFPSLRLKVIRDGLEDAQILTMAKEKGIAIESALKTLIPDTRTFPSENSAYRKLKVQALEAMETSH